MADFACLAIAPQMHINLGGTDWCKIIKWLYCNKFKLTWIKCWLISIKVKT